MLKFKKSKCSHYGERHPAPPDAYAKEPACSWNDNETISGLCLMDYRYPQFAVEKALLLHYEAVTELYKDVLVAANNSANYLTKNGTEKYICASNVTYAHPMRAKNIRGKWRVIVQRVRVHYDTLTQSVRVEQCHREGDQKCPLTAEDATAQSKCIQKETYQRLLVYDPYDYHLPFKMDTFKIPTSCACFVPFVANPEDEDDSSVVSFPLALGRPQGLAFVNGDAPPTGLAQALASDPRPPFAQPVSRPGATGAATGAATADSSGRLSDSGLGYSADDIAVGESERVETGREILSTASQRLSIEEIGSSEDANNDGDDFEEAEYEDFDIARIDKNVLENEYYYYEDDENVDFSPAEFDETLALAAVLTEADLVQMH